MKLSHWLRLEVMKRSSSEEPKKCKIGRSSSENSSKQKISDKKDKYAQ